MNISGTHFNYYQVCKRKLWLFANGISMEHSSDLVYEGKMLHETSYPQRPERYSELEITGIRWQVKYYIYILEQNGIDDVRGILEYPMLRHTSEVVLSDEDRNKITDYRLNKCVLNESGKKIFVKEIDERLNETIQHRSLKRKVSYRHLIRLECYKLAKHLLDIEEYKPFKMYW
jgi:CRISPR-associated exonuclease Cas4